MRPHHACELAVQERSMCHPQLLSTKTDHPSSHTSSVDTLVDRTGAKLVMALWTVSRAKFREIDPHIITSEASALSRLLQSIVLTISD